MKILLLNERLYPDFIGGIEKRNYDLATALAGRGHDVTLGGFGDGPRRLPENIHVISLGDLGKLYTPSGRRTMVQALRLAWRCFRLDVRGFDVVEAANVPYIHLLPLAIRCAQLKVPLVVTWYEYWLGYWNQYVGRLRAPFYIAGEWLAAQLGDFVNATSALTRDRLQHARRRSTPIPVIGCGVNFGSCSGTVSDGHGAGILFAGRLIPEKRVDLLIRALALIPADLHASLTIFGEGPELDSLTELAAALGVAERVHFSPHARDFAVISQAMAQASVAVQPSSREGFGLFPLEAMAHGLPVVYCRSSESALSELVRDGVEGLEAEPDSQHMALALGRLLRDRELRARLSRNALSRAREFDWKELVLRLEGLFTAVTSAANVGLMKEIASESSRV